MTEPHPQGAGVILCIEKALSQSGVAREDAIRTGWIHPNINLENPDAGVDTNVLVGPKKEKLDVKVALSNSFGFGDNCLGVETTQATREKLENGLTKERKERKYAANTEETKSRLSKATTSRMSRWNHTKIFSDFGDEETDNGNSDDMDTKTFSGRHSLPNSKKSLHRSKRAGKSLPEDTYEQLDDEPLDLLDRQKTRLSLRSSDNMKRKLQSDDEPELDADGRLIIREDGTTLKRKPTEADMDARSQAGSNRSFQQPQLTTYNIVKLKVIV
nr:hypothetical protein [Tanacetum cinerariifolium]